MNTIPITKGLDLPIDGRPDQRIEAGAAIQTVALLAADYHGMKPTMLVQEGDAVQTGQPLFSEELCHQRNNISLAQFFDQLSQVSHIDHAATFVNSLNL